MLKTALGSPGWTFANLGVILQPLSNGCGCLGSTRDFDLEFALLRLESSIVTTVSRLKMHQHANLSKLLTSETTFRATHPQFLKV